MAFNGLTVANPYVNWLGTSDGRITALSDNLKSLVSLLPGLEHEMTGTNAEFTTAQILDTSTSVLNLLKLTPPRKSLLQTFATRRLLDTELL